MNKVDLWGSYHMYRHSDIEWLAVRDPIEIRLYTRIWVRGSVPTFIVSPMTGHVLVPRGRVQTS